MLLIRLPFVVVEACDAAAGGAKQCTPVQVDCSRFCVVVFVHGVRLFFWWGMIRIDRRISLKATNRFIFSTILVLDCWRVQNRSGNFRRIVFCGVRPDYCLVAGERCVLCY